jgi:hypothetical protein
MVDTNMQIVVHHPIEPDITRLTFIKGLKDVQTAARTLKRERRKTTTKSYKNWCMPAQPTGYIKCRKHDFL